MKPKLIESIERCRIRLEHENEFGDVYTMEISEEIYEPRETPIDKFGRGLNLFLKQCGYEYFNKDTLLMESVTDEESEVLRNFLADYRAESGGE